jgi:hypothetical protein
MKREAFIIFGLLAITVAAFWEAGHCGFINFDDPGYIFYNPHVTGGLSAANFTWAWKTFYQGNYLPLTWLSLMLDATLFGPGPHGFHWVNLAFHTANAVLVYLVFRQATGAVWRSALVAALFAVHPLRVESVVWIVERKDVLTGFFWLLTALAYLRYVKELRWRWYAATLALFAATLLAKQTLATLPFMLLLMDYWPLGRWRKGPAAVSLDAPPRRSLPQLIVEKLPPLAMAAAIIAVTIRAQASTGSIADIHAVPFADWLANVPVSYALRSGVRDFLRRPLSPEDVRQLLGRMERFAAHPTTSIGKVVALISNKGGVGKSMLSVNIAAELGRRNPGQVLLIDASLQMGVCASMLDLEPTTTLTDAAHQRDRLDQRLIRECRSRTPPACTCSRARMTRWRPRKLTTRLFPA